MSAGGDAEDGLAYTEACETKRSGNDGCTVGVSVDERMDTVR
jgi:hypothetical protein